MKNSNLDFISLSYAVLNKFDTFANFHLMFIQKLEKSKHEEEILKLINDYKLILENLDSNVLTSFLNTIEFHPAIGHFISVLINLALNNKYFKIKKECIDLIETLMNTLNVNYLKKPTINNISDLFGSYLPGICQGIMKLIILDEKQNKVVYISALKALSTLITIVFYRYESGISLKNENAPFLTVRNEEWKIGSMKKIGIVLDKIERCLINQGLDVKEALLNFSCVILFHLIKDENNFNILPLITKSLFKIQLILIFDENDRIKSLADAFIQKVSKNFFEKTWLRDILNEDFFTFMDDFKQEINVCNDDEILNRMKLLCGYIKCLDKVGLEMIFLVENHKNKLFDLLKTVSRLNLNRMSTNVISKEYTLFGNDQWFEKKHKFYENKKIEEYIELCCKLVKKYVDNYFILDFIVEFINEKQKADNKLDILYVLNYFVKNLDQKSQTQILLVKELIDLLSRELERLDSDIEYEDDKNQSIVYCSFLIETITNFAYSIPISEHKIYLLNILYPIMALTGCSHLPIQINAKVSILKLAKIFKYNTIQNLIKSNISYILSQVHIKLKNYNDKENLYLVFKIIYEVTDAHIVNYLEQTFDELLQTLDTFYSTTNLIHLIKILLLSIKNFKKWHLVLTKETQVKLENNLDENDLFLKNLIDFVEEQEKRREQMKEYIEEFNKPINESIILEEQKKLEQFEIDQEKNLENEDKNLPIYLNFTKIILEKTSNFLSHNSIEVRLLILDIILDSLEILRLHEDLLLPAAHVIWDSLILRFKDEPSVLFKCVHCLEILAATCKDFVRSRTIKQALPQIYNFLKLNWKKSLINYKNSTVYSPINTNLIVGKFEKSRETISNAHFFSMNYKLQQLLLDSLGKIAKDLNLSRQDLWPMINILVAYIKDCQPIELRKSAKISLNILEKKDFFAVYFFLNYQDSI